MTKAQASRMSRAEIERWTAAHPGWQLEEGELRRTYQFPSFTESLRFVLEIGGEAERRSHHPDMGIRYRRVKIALLTYAVDGVSDRDLEMAEYIDTLRATFPAAP